MNEFAFPSSEGMSPRGEYIWPTNGISVRDYFAAKALTGLLASESEDHGWMSPEYQHPNGTLTSYKGPENAPYPLIHTGEQRVASLAYKLADAMIIAGTQIL